MRTLQILASLAAAAFVGGALLALVAAARALFWRFRSAPLRANRVELWTLAASVAAAVLAVLWLVVGPFYGGFAGGGSLSSLGSAASAALPRVEVTRSFYAANGPKVIPLLVAPVFITLVPFAVARRGGRPIVQSFCAMLLGAQAAIGMSGYGAFFAPSGVLMLAAGIFASTCRAAKADGARRP